MQRLQRNVQKNRDARTGFLFSYSIGSLSNDDGDSNEQTAKSNRFLRLAKQQLCTCITLFLYISLPSPHNYNVKVPNFRFCRELERDNDFLFLFLNFDTVF